MRVIGAQELNESQNQNDELQRINQRKFEEVLRMKAQKNAQNSTSAKPTALNDTNFASEVSKHTLMIVDFWAPWCGPCRLVSPIIEELAEDYAGRVAFGKLNVDESPVISNQFHVRSIPTILIFKDGRAVDGVVGAVPKALLESKIRPHLSKDQKMTGVPYS